MQTIRRKADPHPQPIHVTQHQMLNIGEGLPLDAQREYVIRYSHPAFIGTFKALYMASNEGVARDLFGFEYWGDHKIESIEVR